MKNFRRTGNIKNVKEILNAFGEVYILEKF